MELHKHLSADKYHSIRAASSSNLKALRGNQLKFISQYLNPQPMPSTDSMALGEMVHCLLLTPDHWNNQFIVVPEEVSKRTKEGKAYFEALEADPRLAVKQSLAEKASAIANSAAQVKIVRKILGHENSLKETSFFWDDDLTNQNCKCRWDCVNPELGLILDIKTTAGGVNATDFSKTIVNYFYDQQAAFYIDAAKIAFSRDSFSFCFVAIDTSDPFDVALYILDDNSVDIGRRIYRENLNNYANIMSKLDKKEISCLTDIIQDKQFETLSLPHWAHDLTKR